jgi:uncharacterized protein (TIRG00374 family)
MAGRRAVHLSLALLAVSLLAVEGVLLAPRLNGVAAALAEASWPLLLLAIAAQLLSFAAFAAMYRQMLRSGRLHVPLRQVGGLVLAANALSATLPAGSAVATGYSFQRMRRLGASIPLATWTVAITGLISGATFTAMAVAGTFSVGGRSGGALSVAVSCGALLAVALMMRAAAQRPHVLTAVGHRLHRAVNRMRRREPSTDADRVEQFVAQLGAIRPRSFDWLAAVSYAALNWAGDVACLVLSCHAVGLSHLSPQLILLTYSADAAAGIVQLLPGGLGTVDGALVVSLVNGGVGVALATAGVVIYRLISFVLMAAIGWVVWFAVRNRTMTRIGSSNDRAP